EQVAVIFLVVPLPQQHARFETIPASRPILVGPDEAERKRESRILQVSLQRLLENAAPVEIIVIKAKPVDTRGARKLDLPREHVPVRQIVKPEVARDARLIVTDEARHATREISPLGEAGAPPLVVFGNRMKLRQVEGH